MMAQAAQLGFFIPKGHLLIKLGHILMNSLSFSVSYLDEAWAYLHHLIFRVIVVFEFLESLGHMDLSVKLQGVICYLWVNFPLNPYST